MSPRLASLTAGKRVLGAIHRQKIQRAGGLPMMASTTRLSSIPIIWHPRARLDLRALLPLTLERCTPRATVPAGGLWHQPVSGWRLALPAVTPRKWSNAPFRMVWRNQRNAPTCDQRADLHITQRCEAPTKFRGLPHFPNPTAPIKKPSSLGFGGKILTTGYRSVRRYQPLDAYENSDG